MAAIKCNFVRHRSYHLRCTIFHFLLVLAFLRLAGRPLPPLACCARKDAPHFHTTQGPAHAPAARIEGIHQDCNRDSLAQALTGDLIMPAELPNELRKKSRC